MHYFTCGDEIACCEKDESAAWLEARGFEPCSYAAFRAAWRERDRVQRLEMARETTHESTQHAPVAPANPGPAMERATGGKVYPNSWKGN